MTRRRPLPAVLLLVLLAGCRGAAPPAEVAPALALFGLAGPEDPGRAELAQVIDDSLLEHDNPALLDALDRLPQAAPPEILRVEPLPGLGRVAVDLRAALPGGASADYSVQTALRADGAWRVVWFQGPGVDWPGRPAPRGAGPGSSAVPEGPPR